MEIVNMTSKELETRMAELSKDIDSITDVAEVEKRYAEYAEIKAELDKRAAAEAKRAEMRNSVAGGIGNVVQSVVNNSKTVEMRNTSAYINAYANYVKTGKDNECRALLSTNGTDASASLTGYVPVPDMVEARIRTAWEKNEILSLVRQTNMKGNVRIGFELTADGAVVHKEGAAAPDEEEITLGIVQIIPESLKKWITVSDEALDLSGEEFLTYIVDEIMYRIAKLAEAELIGVITALPSTATASSVSAVTVAEAPALTTIATAIGKIYGTNFTIAMNRGTWAAFKAVQYEANFPIDVFEGRNVVFTDALPAYADADEGDVYAIVGDFYEGAQVNFPAGNGIQIKVDSLSLAEKDLVKFVGRMFAGFGAVADKRFALISVPEQD